MADNNTPPDCRLEERATEVAMRFHDTYERLAPTFGYHTRVETRQFNPDSPNGRLMIAVCRDLINQGLVAKDSGS